MKEACDALSQFAVGWKAQVVSAHRTPERLFEFSRNAADEGYRIIIAGAGGAAHLPGMIASMTPLPVLGVPVQSRALSGLDSLLSIVQMPKGVAVGTLAIGTAGAYNAGLLAAQMLGSHDDALRQRIAEWKAARADEVLANADLGQG
ncbi:Phosphoribosylaminoimidazole carboxylase carboxyltransferase subunit [Alloalcanivorax dieselolei B5]|uniref:N5-carboxyaminoimidazole ribonucleotide mutase n=4 Tax=Alcanivoracaceae TaxID=224372 RepID=K0CAG5_ALCDB|nr:Phosphoribosylaminoimidazole carboxylase carboxyltransferase subunit [Alloalcanivorax dieselolei B5]CUR47445.1 Phosphoribosylaminoimidazole carboxylase catalytic subunit [Alloalcanivorax xenomutans]|tara:strand:+ start:872 stop:1312 length:441 start_codon:yes stop_codon:yes gene_type:complete